MKSLKKSLSDIMAKKCHDRKRCNILLVAILFSLFANAQFLAGFGCGDPDAWFDKEIFFYCQNQATNYYGYGVNLQNVTFIINGELQLDVSGVWEYGDFIIIDKSNDIEFEKGSIVA